MLSPVLVELLLRLAREAALRAGVGPLAAVVHLVLLQLPLGPEHLLADAAPLGVLRVVDLEVQAQRAQLLEALLALRALEHAVHRRVRLQERVSRSFSKPRSRRRRDRLRAVRLGEFLVRSCANFSLWCRRAQNEGGTGQGTVERGVTRSWTPFTTHNSRMQLVRRSGA